MKKRTIILAILIIAVLGIVVAVLSLVNNAGSKEPEPPQETSIAEPEATSAAEPQPTAPVEEAKDLRQTEYDDSVVRAEDIVTSEIPEVTVDDKRHLILKFSNKKTKDLGYIGGEKTKKTYVVAFLNYNYELLKAEIVEEGQTATPPKAPVREGYVFHGWSEGAEKVKQDCAVIASYVKRDMYCTVTFLDFDGKALRYEMVAAGGCALGPTVTPARESYIFAGWDQSLADVTGDRRVTAQYVPEGSPVFAAEAVTAKPGDKEVAVTISLKNNPGICSINLQAVYDASLTLSKFAFNNEQLAGMAMGPEPLPAVEKASFLWFRHDANLSDDCAYVTLYFDVAEDAALGAHSIKLSYNKDDVFGIDEVNVEMGVIDGQLIVG